MSDLERRIATALTDDAVTSNALSELIQATDAALVTADASVEEERDRANSRGRKALVCLAITGATGS